MNSDRTPDHSAGAGQAMPRADGVDAVPRLLDVTRLASRVGRGPLTGIDRVELAYLRRFAAEQVPLTLLLATRDGVMLLGRGAAETLDALLTSAVAETPKRWWHAGPRRRALWALWRQADAQAAERKAGPMIASAFPAGGVYVNVGHANLTEAGLAVIRAAGLRIIVMIHDTIPLDHPQLCRPSSHDAFAAKLGASALADVLICNSEATRADVARHLQVRETAPRMVVAPLGVAVARPDRAQAARIPGRDRPYFVVLGTVEPRKNHAFLLDLWERMALSPPEGGVPGLFIIGTRGWQNADVFRKLDRLAPGGRVRELSGLGDGVVAALVADSAGLLFPTRAEGFGLPAAEAAAMGVPVVCTPLPAFREILGDYPVYAATDDGYPWVQAIETLVGVKLRGEVWRAPPPMPGWDAHFRIIAAETARMV